VTPPPRRQLLARLRAFRPCQGPPLTWRPTALPNARWRPMAPSRTGPLRVPRPPMRRPGGCRQFLRRPHPGPGLKLVPPAPTRRPRGPRGLRARPALRGRRGPRSPRPTSAGQGRPKGARPAPLRVPPRRAAQEGSAQAPPQAVPTSGARAVRMPGRPRRGPRDLVLPGRVRPGQADPVRARVLHVPARGRATTRSVRPRPAWGRRPPLGPRAQVRLVSPAVPVLRPAAQAAQVVQAAQGVQGGRVRPGAARVGPACPTAARVPAGSRVRVPAAPGLAR